MEPYMLALRSGDGLTVRNRDGCVHRLWYQLPSRQQPVGQTLNPSELTGLVFWEPALFAPVQCELHVWETAYLSVLDHPYFALTAADGRFVITNLPPGRYVLEACHLASHGTNGLTRTVAIRAGQTVPADFVVEVREPATPPPSL